MAVSLSCTHGTIEIELYYKDTPRTCRNFIELCKAGYYDGINFHRLIPGFMCQSGDPYGDGTGGESIYGPTFEDEIVAKLSHDRVGVVSMANAGRNTNSSQFFITFKPCPHLDGKHTVFGHVSESSLSVLDDMQLVKTKNKKPVKPIKIFVAEVTYDPWAGDALPAGASIPDKPLIQAKGRSRGPKQCTIQ